jgi:nitrile hydratase beta subunit-like protein
MSDAFGIGQQVRVRRAWPPGHVRTPHYVRGKPGVVDAIVGHYPNPEELAYGRDGQPRRALYRVRFRQRELWADYQGPGSDSAVVDLFEHWLEPAKDAGP